MGRRMFLREIAAYYERVYCTGMVLAVLNECFEQRSPALREHGTVWPNGKALAGW